MLVGLLLMHIQMPQTSHRPLMLWMLFWDPLTSFHSKLRRIFVQNFSNVIIMVVTRKWYFLYKCKVLRNLWGTRKTWHIMSDSWLLCLIECFNFLEIITLVTNNIWLLLKIISTFRSYSLGITTLKFAFAFNFLNEVCSSKCEVKLSFCYYYYYLLLKEQLLINNFWLFRL